MQFGSLETDTYWRVKFWLNITTFCKTVFVTPGYFASMRRPILLRWSRTIGRLALPELSGSCKNRRGDEGSLDRSPRHASSARPWCLGARELVFEAAGAAKWSLPTEGTLALIPTVIVSFIFLLRNFEFLGLVYLVDDQTNTIYIGLITLGCSY